MIFISTGSYKNLSIEESLNFLYENDIKNVELSSGQHDPEIENTLRKYKSKLNFMFHNYFPPPKISFTLNLATLDDEIFKICKNHILKSIQLSSLFKIPYYSFHAGILIDPDPKELGKKISVKKINDKKKATEVFLERLHMFSIEAKKEGINLLVENNVINKVNFNTFKQNPFMMSSLQESLSLVKEFPSNINILLDLAHLKVSANTLSFSTTDYLDKLDHKIWAYHVSDNDGLFDTNELISEKSWFAKYLKKDKKYFTLELKTQNSSEIKKQIKILNNILN